MSNATNDQSNIGPTNATSQTEFSQSTESQAQMKNAPTTAQNVREVLNVYRPLPHCQAI